MPRFLTALLPGCDLGFSDEAEQWGESLVGPETLLSADSLSKPGGQNLGPVEAQRARSVALVPLISSHSGNKLLNDAELHQKKKKKRNGSGEMCRNRALAEAK